MSARSHAGLQLPKGDVRPVSRPHDADEREADRAAQVVARGGSVAGWSFASIPASRAPVQRQGEMEKRDEERKKLVEKSDEEKKKEAISKTVEAVQETPPAKALKDKILADPLVRTVKEAATSTPGLIAGGAVVAGGVGALAATGKPLPVQPPEIPLDKVTPGLSAKVTYQGPVNAPTFVGLTVTYKEQGPKGKGSPQGDRIAADIARLKAQEQMFKPESQKAAEKKQEDELVQAWIRSQGALPGLKVPLVGTPPTSEEPAKKEEETAPVLRAPASTSAEPVAQANVDHALASPGRPLDPRTRRSMEARFGYDFSGVRVHDDARAAATAADINAAAFTVGQEIAFGAGRYAPSTGRGRELLAHELAHTIQQRGGERKAPPISPGSALEQRAAEAGRAAANGRPVTQTLGRSGIAVARQVIGNEGDWVPQGLQGSELEEFRRLWPLLRTGHDYPGRQHDLARLELMKALANMRIQNRTAAVAEAEATIARMNAEEAEAAVAPAPRPTAPRSQFEPGGFDYDAWLAENYAPSVARIRRESERAPDPRPFEDRVKEARRRAWMPADLSEWADSVWQFGLENRLFAPHEEKLVRQAIVGPRRRREKEESKRERMRVAYRGQLEREHAVAQIQLGAFQAPAVGAFGEAAAALYLGYTGVESVVQMARAKTPEEGVGVLLPWAAGIGFQQIAGGGPRATSKPSPPGGGGLPAQPPGGAGPRTPATPVEASPAEVRAAYSANPDAVKHSSGDAWHQFRWERAWREGGAPTTKPAPIAFRTQEGTIVVNDVRWLAVGDIAEISQPQALKPAGAPVAAEKARSAIAYAKTGVPDDPGLTPGTPPSLPAAGARAGAGGAPAVPRNSRGYRAVPPEVVIEAHKLNPDSIVRSDSHSFHKLVWGGNEPPVAFRVGSKIRVDLERAPPELLAELGLSMHLTGGKR